MSSSASNKKKMRPSKNGADRRHISGGSSGRRTNTQENGGKRMQSYCLRYALRVIDKHTKTSNNGSIRSSNHKKEIIARLGKRLRGEMMPPSYCKAEDPVVDNMVQSNKQRETEVEAHKKAVDKLEKQLAMAAEALKRARKQKERSQKELNRIRQEQKTGKDALPAVFGHGLEGKDAVLPTVTSTTHMNYKRAPVGTMSDLLKQLS